MNRIMIIGCCGAGKSTLARKLADATGLPLIHLDTEYWQPNWTETPKPAWENKVLQLARKPRWIIDGNYGGTMNIRINRADTIIYLDFPTIRCLSRITKRTLRYFGKTRPDMPEGCNERFSLEFYHYVATFNLVRRKGLMKKLAANKENKQIHILKNDKQVSEFLNSLVGLR